MPTDAEYRARPTSRYHDAAAKTYDGKWSVSFDARAERQVRTKLTRALGRRPPRFERVLELGTPGPATSASTSCGWGSRARSSRPTSHPAWSPCASRTRCAAGVGQSVSGRVADAESLPFEGGSFDAVVGHAVLHHIPDLRMAWREVARVLAPGGTAVFLGEPSRIGDRLASVPKQAAWRAAAGVASAGRRRAAAVGDPRAAAGARPTAMPRRTRRSSTRSCSSRNVDIHAFAASDLRVHATRCWPVRRARLQARSCWPAGSAG